MKKILIMIIISCLVGLLTSCNKDTVLDTFPRVGSSIIPPCNLTVRQVARMTLEGTRPKKAKINWRATDGEIIYISESQDVIDYHAPDKVMEVQITIEVNVGNQRSEETFQCNIHEVIVDTPIQPEQEVSPYPLDNPEVLPSVEISITPTIETFIVRLNFPDISTVVPEENEENEDQNEDQNGDTGATPAPTDCENHKQNCDGYKYGK